MSIDFKRIKLEYEREFSDQSKKGSDHLSFHVEDWPNVLNEIQIEIFREIKSVGVCLYPFYPIGDSFINFGNPFSKIGLEIIYKDYIQEKENKINEFKKKGWKVYKINTNHDRSTLEELFKRKYKRDLENDEDYFNFLDENKDNNLDCLLNYLRIII